MVTPPVWFLTMPAAVSAVFRDASAGLHGHGYLHRPVAGTLRVSDTWRWPSPARHFWTQRIAMAAALPGAAASKALPPQVIDAAPSSRGAPPLGAMPPGSAPPGARASGARGSRLPPAPAQSAPPVAAPPPPAPAADDGAAAPEDADAPVAKPLQVPVPPAAGGRR